jgi:hypothetical protein
MLFFLGCLNWEALQPIPKPDMTYYCPVRYKDFMSNDHYKHDRIHSSFIHKVNLRRSTPLLVMSQEYHHSPQLFNNYSEGPALNTYLQWYI